MKSKIIVLLIAFSTFSFKTAQSTHLAAHIFKSTVSGTCSILNGYLTLLPFFASFFDAQYRKDGIEIKRPIDQTIQNLIHTEAKNRDISNITVENGGNDHDYNTADSLRIIYVPEIAAKELLPLLQKKKLTLEEQQIIDFHRGRIHHELTHIERQSFIQKKSAAIPAVIITQSTASIIKKVFSSFFEKINKSFILKNSLKIIGGITKLYIIFTLINLYKKYDELKCDDGIPNEKGLLEMQAQNFRNRFEPIMQDIQWINNFPFKKLLRIKTKLDTGKMEQDINNNFSISEIMAIKLFGPEKFNTWPILSEIFCEHYRNSDHPSNLRRAIRFEKRIEQLKEN